jgi:hypothetical protein
MTQAVEEQG